MIGAIQILGNIIACILAVGCFVISIMIYKVVNARPLLWLILASGCGLILRILLNIETMIGIDVYDTSYVAIFYIFLFTAYWTMYQVFKKYIK
jgi:hypothetical protein